MSEPLTDADLRELAIRFPTHLGEPKLSVLIQRAVSEIRGLRSSRRGLTADERDALKFARGAVLNRVSSTAALVFGPEWHRQGCRALAVLDRLLGTEGK